MHDIRLFGRTFGASLGLWECRNTGVGDFGDSSQSFPGSDIGIEDQAGIP